MWYIYVALAIVFIFMLDDYLIDKRQLELAKKLNGPMRLPLIGTAYRMLRVSSKGKI